MKTFPLLQSQLGVFYDCLKYPKVMQYNVPSITPLSDGVDFNRIEAAFQAIFAARKVLRLGSLSTIKASHDNLWMIIRNLSFCDAKWLMRSSTTMPTADSAVPSISWGPNRCCVWS